MAGRKSDFTLPTNAIDDLFLSQEERDEAKLKKIVEIPLALIDAFPGHPFKVVDDEEMLNLAESIKEYGVMTPAIVRQKEDGRYEMIAGHRRKEDANWPEFKRCGRKSWKWIEMKPLFLWWTRIYSRGRNFCQVKKRFHIKCGWKP